MLNKSSIVRRCFRLFCLIIQKMGVNLGVKSKEMSITITHRINKGIVPRKGRTDLQIRLRITYCGNRLDLYPGLTIEADKWIDTALVNGELVDVQQVKKGCKSSQGYTATQINNALDERVKFVEKLFEEYEESEHTPTPEEIRDRFNSRFTAVITRKETFFTIFDKFMRKQGKDANWQSATYEKFRNVKNHLKNFDKKLTFQKLDAEGLIRYRDFLWETEKLNNASTNKQLDFVHQFLSWAEKNGYCKTNFKDFKAKMKTLEKDIFALTDEELELMKNYVFNDEEDRYHTLEYTRDCFVFSCYTGLRHSDIFRMTKEQVDYDGKMVSIPVKKTRDFVKVPLHEAAMEILLRYKDEIFDGNRALPILTDQKCNKNLKTIGKKCGLVEPRTIHKLVGTTETTETKSKYEYLSFHCGRRTFISRMLSAGAAPAVVMSITGHKKYEAMRPYIRIMDPAKREAIDKLK